VKLIVVRRSEGVHDTPHSVTLDVDGGIHGDRWGSNPKRDPASQITLMSSWVAELLGAREQPLHMAGDNLLVDIDLSLTVAGSRVRVGGAVVEVTAKPHAGCHKFAARFGQDALRWVNWAPHRERRLRGVHAKVVESGPVTLGDVVEVVT